MGYRMIFVMSWLATALSACGDASHGSEQARNGLKPPKFTFSPGPEGRAVGVRAVVDIDGVQLTSEPVEVILQSESAQRSTTSLSQLANIGATPGIANRVFRGSPDASRHVNNTKPASNGACPMRGETVANMGTVNGAVCYISQTAAAGLLAAEKSVSSMLIFAREGLYSAGSTAGSIYIPPDFAHISSIYGVGCVFGDQQDAISTEYFQSLESIGVSYSLFNYTLGYEVFTSSGLGLVRAIQYDSGYSASMSMVPSSLGLSVQTSSTTVQAPVFLRPWHDNCGSVGNADNAIAYFRGQLELLQDNGDTNTIEDSLATEIAAGAFPLLDSLGSPGVGGLAENVPAGSNADMYGQFLVNRGNQLPSTATNTSIDGQLLNFKNTVGAGGDDTASVVNAIEVHEKLVEGAVPSLVGQAALQRDAEPAMAAATQLASLLESNVAAAKRFASPRIVHIDVEPGTKAEITITATEIAELINREPQDVMGATVIANAGPEIQNAAFTLSSDPLVLVLELSKDSLLVQFDVDLTTAKGTFPSDVSSWIVRPAMRLIRHKAGKAANVLLSAPTQIRSGGPASLNVQVVDADGRLVKSPYSIHFVDDSGVELGQAEPKHGTALFQYVPKPSVPAISSVEQLPLVYKNATVSGLRITGTGLSKDSKVFLNDATAAVSPDLVSVQTPEQMLVALPQGTANGQLTIKVRNPGGQSSNTQTLNLSGL